MNLSQEQQQAIADLMTAVARQAEEGMERSIATDDTLLGKIIEFAARGGKLRVTYELAPIPLVRLDMCRLIEDGRFELLGIFEHRANVDLDSMPTIN